jgi:hypothetical protein
MSDVDTLFAKQAITEVIYRYCRAFDRMDRDMAATIWHPDGTCNYTNKPGTPDTLARDYFGPSEAARGKLTNHSHQVTNILIELSGGRAVSESYFIALLQTQPDNGKVQERIVRGRYLDRWSRRNGTWAIDHRHVIFDSFVSHDVPAHRTREVPMDLARRDKSDPSYALFASLKK